MWFTRLFAVLAMVAVMTGCGSSGTSVRVKPPAAQEQVKAGLQDLAKAGEITSGVMIIRQQLEEMKKTDSAKAEGLLKDLTELESLKGSAANKAQAHEILSKL